MATHSSILAWEILWLENGPGGLYGFPGSSVGKESACNTGDPGSIPEYGVSPGEGNGYPLSYSGLGNSIDCVVHGVANRWTRQQLSLDGLQSMGSQRVRHDLATEHAQACTDQDCYIPVFFWRGSLTLCNITDLLGTLQAFSGY